MSHKSLAERVPGDIKALTYEFNIEFCFDTNRDIVKVIPFAFAGVQLNDSSIGHILLTSSSREGRVIKLGDPPVRTASERYTGKLTVNFTFTPAGGAVQSYLASATIIIDRFGANIPPTELDRV